MNVFKFVRYLSNKYHSKFDAQEKEVIMKYICNYVHI